MTPISSSLINLQSAAAAPAARSTVANGPDASSAVIAPAPAAAVAMPAAASAMAVSYTHLTLPTILRV